MSATNSCLLIACLVYLEMLIANGSKSLHFSTESQNGFQVAYRRMKKIVTLLLKANNFPNCILGTTVYKSELNI